MVSLPDDLRGELWRDVFIRHGIGTSNPGLPSARYRSTWFTQMETKYCMYYLPVKVNDT
jgi:hypothetical protein